MKGFQKFLTKIVCVLVIFGGVVGESERAWGATTFTNFISEYCSTNFRNQPQCLNQVYNTLSSTGTLSYALSLFNSGKITSLVDLLVNLMQVANTAISGISSSTNTNKTQQPSFGGLVANTNMD